MKLNRVIVISKKLKRRAGTYASPLRFAIRRKEHHETLRTVIETLKHRGISLALVERERLPRRLTGDLVITVGGDGTFLAAAHAVDDTPIFGVNSHPKMSTGFFCLAKKLNFSSILDKILQGKKRPTPLPRLRCQIDGLSLAYPALNDILFAGPSPADSVYYRLRIGQMAELQRSSGIWICAGPGSTAGFYSAGGRPAAITSKRLRFLVREPCRLPDTQPYRWLRGVLARGEILSIRCEGVSGRIYLDGTALIKEIGHGQTLRVEIDPKPLHAFLNRGV